MLGRKLAPPFRDPDLRHPRISAWLLGAAGIVALIVGVRVFNLDYRLHYAWQAWNTSEAVRDQSIWLPGYRADVSGLPIEGVSENASGITYDHDRDSLWVVVNNPPALIELDLDFRLRRKIELVNFRDPEGVAYLGDGAFAIVDERSRALIVAPVERDTSVLDRHRLSEVVVYRDDSGNRGLEGVAVDSIAGRVFVVREQDPRQLFMVNGLVDEAGLPSVELAIDIDMDDIGLDDLSGLHFDATTRHLLVLSEDSKKLAELDLQGNRISYMGFEWGLGGLAAFIPHPEGVTMDGQGRLYVVSEPNLIYRFRQ